MWSGTSTSLLSGIPPWSRFTNYFIMSLPEEEEFRGRNNRARFASRKYHPLFSVRFLFLRRSYFECFPFERIDRNRKETRAVFLSKDFETSTRRSKNLVIRSLAAGRVIRSGSNHPLFFVISSSFIYLYYNPPLCPSLLSSEQRALNRNLGSGLRGMKIEGGSFLKPRVELSGLQCDLRANRSPRMKKIHRSRGRSVLLFSQWANSSTASWREEKKK